MLYRGCEEAIWLQGLFEEFTSSQKSMVVYLDSQSTIHLSKCQIFYERTKQIDVKFHFIRDVIEKCTVTVKKIGTTNNLVDMMMKPLSVAKFMHCLDLVGIYST